MHGIGAIDGPGLPVPISNRRSVPDGSDVSWAGSPAVSSGGPGEWLRGRRETVLDR